MSQKQQTARIMRGGRNYGELELDTLDSPLNTALNLSGEDTKFDVIIRTDNNQYDVLLTPQERQNITLGEALARLSQLSQDNTAQITIDITAAHEGATLVPVADAKPTLLVSDSLASHIQHICKVATDTVGGVEIPWLLAGYQSLEHNSVYLLQTSILPAVCTSVSFKVSSRDLSDTNGGMAAKFPNMNLMGIAHRHPGLVAPRPSGTDVSDFKTINDLLYVLNLAVKVQERRIVGSVVDEVVNYSPFKKLNCAVAINQDWPADVPLPELVWQEQWNIAFLAAVIYNSQGELPYGEVMETREGPCGKHKKLHTECPYTVIADSDIAAQLGIPLTDVQITSDDAAIANEVRSKLQPVQYAATGNYWQQQQPRPDYYNSGYNYRTSAYNYGASRPDYNPGVATTSSSLPVQANSRQLIAALKEVEHAIGVIEGTVKAKKPHSLKFLTDISPSATENLLYDIWYQMSSRNRRVDPSAY